MYMDKETKPNTLTFKNQIIKWYTDSSFIKVLTCVYVYMH